MREIIISRPKRFECAAVALNVTVNGRMLDKIKNNQRIVMQVDDGPQEIKVHGGFMSGKAFADTLKIPAGSHGYELRVDFISGNGSNYVPLLRPSSGEFIKADTRTITLLGATLCKLLMDEKLRDGLRNLPGAQLRLIILPTEWRVLLCHGDAAKTLFTSEYSHATGGLTAAMINALEHGDLKTPEGRAKICDKVMTDYASCLPEYERVGADGLVFMG